MGKFRTRHEQRCHEIGSSRTIVWRVSRQAIIALALVVCLQGCAAAGLAVLGAGAGVGMGTGVEHQLNGISYKTFAVPVASAHRATRATLARLGMPIRSDTATNNGRSLTASA